MKLRTLFSSGSRLALLAPCGLALLVAGCGGEEPPAKPRDTQPKVEVSAFENVFDCASATGMSRDECAAARTEAVAVAAQTAPRFAAAFDCEAAWGAGNCMAQEADGTGFFIPFVSGFLLGKVTEGSKRAIVPLYRRVKDGPLLTGAGVELTPNGGTGKFLAPATVHAVVKDVPKIAPASAAASQANLAKLQEEFPGKPAPEEGDDKGKKKDDKKDDKKSEDAKKK